MNDTVAGHRLFSWNNSGHCHVRWRQGSSDFARASLSPILRWRIRTELLCVRLWGNSDL